MPYLWGFSMYHFSVTSQNFSYYFIFFCKFEVRFEVRFEVQNEVVQSA